RGRDELPDPRQDVQAIELRREALRREDAARLHEGRHAGGDPGRGEDRRRRREDGPRDRRRVERDGRRGVARARDRGAEIARGLRRDGGDRGGRERDRAEERDRLAREGADRAVTLLERLSEPLRRRLLGLVAHRAFLFATFFFAAFAVFFLAAADGFLV